MAVVSTEAVVLTIMDIVKNQTLEKAELIERVCSASNYSFPVKVNTLISALLASGSIVNTDAGIIPGTNYGNANSGNENYQQKFYEAKKQAEKQRDAVVELEQEKAALLKKVSEVVKNAEEGIAKANKRAEEARGQIVEVQIKEGKNTVRKVEGVFHAKFKRILSLAKRRKNIFIYGPTGCGKTHVCQQVAEALNLPFYFVSCTSGMSESTLGGRLLPTGNSGKFEYTISEFVKAYENGGVFLLDEMDAADPNVLLVINSALANKRMAVPNRPAKPYAIRHKNFVCIAAANTVGTGADRLYSGRNKLDAATLDRFAIGKVFMDYDPALETALCPDNELRELFLNYRDKVRTHRMERSMSTRFLQDAYEMKTEAEWTIEEIQEAFFEGWRDDEKNKVMAR